MKLPESYGCVQSHPVDEPCICDPGLLWILTTIRDLAFAGKITMREWEHMRHSLVPYTMLNCYGHKNCLECGICPGDSYIPDPGENSNSGTYIRKLT